MTVATLPAQPPTIHKDVNCVTKPGCSITSSDNADKQEICQTMISVSQQCNAASVQRDSTQSIAMLNGEDSFQCGYACVYVPVYRNVAKHKQGYADGLYTVCA